MKAVSAAIYAALLLAVIAPASGDEHNHRVSGQK